MVANTSEAIVVKTYDTLEEAQRHAGAEAANTGAFSVPVIVFRQGARTIVTGALPMSWVRARLESRSAKQRSSLADVQSAWNRPEYPDHSKIIARYLIENHKKKYIIPPLTLNIQHKVDLYMVNYPASFLPGYLVIPGTARLAITDGQHRRSAITTALDQMTDEEADEFGSDAIAVMVTCETDIYQIHQDFADCSKTKPIPPSLLAVYDRRNPANRLVSDMEHTCSLFTGRVDSSSKTLSPRSTYLFLANQLRQLAKELLAGSYAMADAGFGKRAMELLSTEDQYNDALKKYSGYINHLTRIIPVWAEIAELPAGSLETSQIPGKRAEGWVCLTATGLNLIGRIGHRIFTNGELNKNWEQHADRLGQLDWRRSAEIWQNTIVQSNRIMNQQVPLKRAFERVCQALDLDKTDSLTYARA